MSPLIQLPKIPKNARLPLALAALGVSYCAVTMMQKPPFTFGRTSEVFMAWERHRRDGLFAAVAGLGAGAVLWWAQ